MELMLNAVGAAVEFFDNVPGSCHGEHDLADTPFRGNRFCCALCKDNVADGVNARVWAGRVDEFAVPAAMLIKQDFSNVAACG